MLTVLNQPDLAPLLFSSLLATKKRTPAAVRRCAKRMARTLQHISELDGQGLDETHPGMAVEARAIMAKTCRMCGMCKGP